MTKKILYIEDNYQNYRLIMRILMRHQDTYEISNAPDAKTALSVMRESRPDLILMDINLPDLDGMELTRRIKADPDFVGIPIVALTANAMVGDKEKFITGGCDGYLRKPVDRAELTDTLVKFLGNGSKPDV